MNRRFFAMSGTMIVIAGAGILYWALQRPEVHGGLVDGQQIQAHQLVIRTVDGTTREPVGGIVVQVDEQASAASQSRNLVHQAVQTTDSGVAHFSVPDGNYTIRSGSASWYGILTAQVYQDADLYLNLRPLSQEELL